MFIILNINDNKLSTWFFIEMCSNFMNRPTLQFLNGPYPSSIQPVADSLLRHIVDGCDKLRLILASDDLERSSNKFFAVPVTVTSQ